jgi:hypothetical protein
MQSYGGLLLRRGCLIIKMSRRKPQIDPKPHAT